MAFNLLVYDVIEFDKIHIQTKESPYEKKNGLKQNANKTEPKGVWHTMCVLRFSRWKNDIYMVTATIEGYTSIKHTGSNKTHPIYMNFDEVSHLHRNTTMPCLTIWILFICLHKIRTSQWSFTLSSALPLTPLPFSTSSTWISRHYHPLHHFESNNNACLYNVCTHFAHSSNIPYRIVNI